jgi:hypothetical protein
MFEKKYGGSAAEEGKCVVQTLDGGYMLCGYTTSNIPVVNAYLVKTDNMGDTLWTKHYGGAIGETANWVCQNNDSGYTFTGTTNSYGPGTPNFSNTWVVRTDKNGDTLWTRSYDFALKNDKGVYVMQTSDGGFLVLAYTVQGTVPYGRAYKLTATGALSWSAVMPTGVSSFCYSAMEDVNGDFLIAGGYYGVSSYDGFVRRFSPTGTLLSTKTYDMPGNSAQNIFHMQRRVNTAGYYLAGIDGPGFDVYLVKTDANLDTVWTTTISTFFSSSNYATKHYSTQQTADGGFIFAGYTTSANNQVKLIKTDSMGVVQWTKYYGGADADWGYCVSQTPDDGYIISGMADYQSTTVIQAYLIKTDSLGNSSVTTGIADEKSGNDILALPNPSSGVYTLYVPNTGMKEVVIYNSIGATIYQNYFSNDLLVIDLSGSRSGVYYLKVLTANKIVSDKKLILINE